MKYCDLCNDIKAESELTTFSPTDIRKAIENGFNPFKAIRKLANSPATAFSKASVISNALPETQPVPWQMYIVCWLFLGFASDTWDLPNFLCRHFAVRFIIYGHRRRQGTGADAGYRF